MPSESELSVDGSGSSGSSHYPSTTKLKKKRKRGLKIDCESSDSCSSPRVKNKKTKILRKVKSFNKCLDVDELNTSSTDEETGIIRVREAPKTEKVKEVLQQRGSDSDSCSDHDAKGSASKLKGEKNVAGSVSKVSASDSTASDKSGLENSSELLDSSLTGHVEVKTKCKQKIVQHRKKKVNKAKLILEGKSIDSSANTSDERENCCVSDTNNRSGKKVEKIQCDSDSELSRCGESNSAPSMRTDQSELKVEKKARSSKSVKNPTREDKKLPRSKLSKVTSHRRKSSSNSDSDSGLEGSGNDRTSEKIENNETQGRQVDAKDLGSSSGSESELAIKKSNPVDKRNSSSSSSDSNPDEQNRKNVKCPPALQRSSFSSDDNKKQSNAHSVSSSDSDSEVDLKQPGSKNVKNEEIRKKTSEATDKKKTKKSVEDPHKDRSVMRAKRYVKEAGLRIQNYTSLWAGCRSNKARAKAIISFLHENGLSGTPTLEKCKRLRVKREKKNEASELDLTNIITTGRESRRSSALMQKPVAIDSPTKQDIKSRFARIQALGDSDSSSE